MSTQLLKLDPPQKIKELDAASEAEPVSDRTILAKHFNLVYKCTTF